jgi:hypothetical protein
MQVANRAKQERKQNSHHCEAASALCERPKSAISLERNGEISPNLWFGGQPLGDQSLFKGVIAVFVFFTFFIFSAGDAHAAVSWYSNSWGYRKEIVIDRSMVSGTSESSQSDFPVLISLSSDGELRSRAQTDGDDILFTSSDGTTKLKHEIEIYTLGTGALIAWVKVPTLSASANTTLYLYYGNPTCSSQQDAANVWDSNYKAVYHMADNAANTTVFDSTSNARGGTNQVNTSTKTTTGQIDGALTYNGSSDYTSVTDSADVQVASVRTVSLWYNRSEKTSVMPRLIVEAQDANNAWGFSVSGDNDTLPNEVTFGYYIAGTMHGRASPNNSISGTGSNVYIVATTDGTNVSAIYINGASQTLQVQDLLVGTAGRLYIGARTDAARFFNGNLDEVRISSIARSADWIKTEYNNQSAPSSYITVSKGQNSVVQNWFRKGWKYRKQITIDKSMVNSSDQTNFPVLIYKSADDDTKTYAQADADDIVFTKSDGITQLAHEIEKFDPSTGELVAWVRIPSLSASVNTVIYMYYANSSATSQQNATSVWGGTYKAVWHLGESYSTASGNYKDSTTTANATLVDANANSSSVAGKVGNAVNLNGDADYVSVPISASIKGSTTFTVEAWVKTGVLNSAAHRIFAEVNNNNSAARVSFGIDADNKMLFVVLAPDNGTDTTLVDSSTALSTDTWYFVSGVYDSVSDSHSLYINSGVETNTASITSIDNTDPGAVSRIGAGPTGSSRWQGAVDEVRVSTTARTQDWLKTEYNNQNSPATYLTFGQQHRDPAQNLQLFE